MSTLERLPGISSATRLEIDLRGAVLPGVDFSDADFSNAKLSRLVLSGGSLHGTDLSAADLREARLDGVDLRNADLSYANLENADLCRADARGATCGATDFTGANLQCADLRGVDLSMARNLAGAAIVDAFLDESTRLPQETRDGVIAWVDAQRDLGTSEDWLREYLHEHLGGLAKSFLVAKMVKV